MICTGINCGDLTGKKYSENLNGALSANQEFFYIDMIIHDIVGEYSHRGLFSHKEITSFIPENIIVDKDNDILVTDSGAIVEAYDFKGLNDKERESFSNMIINNYRQCYPDYEFALLPGEFPLGINGSITINNKLKRNQETIMSSHILYITDYKKHLENGKANIKK